MKLDLLLLEEEITNKESGKNKMILEVFNWNLRYQNKLITHTERYKNMCVCIHGLMYKYISALSAERA